MLTAWRRKDCRETLPWLMPRGENTGMEALVAYLSHCLLYREEIFRGGSETVPARIPMHVRKPDHDTSSSSSSGRG